MPRIVAVLAESEPDRRSAVQRVWWLWIGLFLLGTLLLLIVAAIGRRRRAIAGTARRATPVKPIKDAWEEAGKRAEPLPEDDIGPEDDS